MDTIIGEVVNNVVISVPDTSVINTSTMDTSVSTESVSTIVVEVNSASTIIAGQPGPQGIPGGEEEMPYAKQTDFATESLIYKGEAAVGSLASNPVWRIHRIIIAGDNDVSETWAGGDANFNKIWDNRASLTYV